MQLAKHRATEFRVQVTNATSEHYVAVRHRDQSIKRGAYRGSCKSFFRRMIALLKYKFVEETQYSSSAIRK